MNRNITITKFLEGIDIQIKQMEEQKKWYLDYRCGSGMSPMLEEFASMIDRHISGLKLIKTIAVNIDPRSLLDGAN